MHAAATVNGIDYSISADWTDDTCEIFVGDVWACSGQIRWGYMTLSIADCAAPLDDAVYDALAGALYFATMTA